MQELDSNQRSLTYKRLSELTTTLSCYNRIFHWLIIGQGFAPCIVLVSWHSRLQRYSTLQLQRLPIPPPIIKHKIYKRITFVLSSGHSQSRQIGVEPISFIYNMLMQLGRFELSTSRVETECSIQLSYSCKKEKYHVSNTST